MEIQTSEDAGVVTIEMSGELDIACVAELDSAVADAAGRDPEMVVLDLRGLSFLDSSGLRAILGAHERGRDGGWRLVVVRGPDEVQRVFRVTRIEERLDMVDEAPAAPA